LRELWVELGERRYAICIGRGLLVRAADLLSPFLNPSSSLLVVSNPAVAELYAGAVESSLAAAGYKYGLALVPDGEEAKTLSVLAGLYDRAFEAGLDRRSAVLALGGGVVGDVAGFLAATYMRGVTYAQLPTTLLAQVDSSVGGKVAVNLPHGKNLVGAFYQPRLVVVDLNTLATLPAREWRCGLAEVVKYGVIWDEGLFELLESQVGLLARYAAPCLPEAGSPAPGLAARSLDSGTVSLLEEIVWCCCRIKAEVVARDEREEEGLRMILNFGHTVGHAVEALTGYTAFRHGEAVAIGMAAEGRLAVAMGMWPPQELARLERLLSAFSLPTRLPPELSPDAVLEAMHRDKKAVGGTLTVVLPRRLGEVTVVRDVPEERVKEVLEESRS
jgi:3-dehydroquinate synthase